LIVAEKTITDTIAEELTEIYLKNEWWHTKKLSKSEALKYHKALLDKGNILVYREDNELLGYVEFWNINFEQFGKLICKEPFSPLIQNVTDGNIAYLANTWINPKYRHTKVYRILKMNFFTVNYHCEYFVGEALRKKTQPVKVFKRDQLIKGVNNG